MPTSGCASVGKAKANEWDVSLERGARAPYSGVLVPEDAYRFYQVDGVLFATCKERLGASVGECEECDPWFSSRQFSFALFGIVLGMLAVGGRAR